MEARNPHMTKHTESVSLATQCGLVGAAATKSESRILLCSLRGEKQGSPMGQKRKPPSAPGPILFCLWGRGKE